MAIASDLDDVAKEMEGTYGGVPLPPEDDREAGWPNLEQSTPLQREAPRPAVRSGAFEERISQIGQHRQGRSGAAH